MKIVSQCFDGNVHGPGEMILFKLYCRSDIDDPGSFPNQLSVVYTGAQTKELPERFHGEIG